MNENETDQPNMNNGENTQEEVQPEMIPEQEEKSMGVVLGTIVVIIILLVAAFYLWVNREEIPETPPETPPIEEPVTTAREILEETDPIIEALEEQGTSDELEVIEDALMDTNLDGLTQELEEIDVELGL